MGSPVLTFVHVGDLHAPDIPPGLVRSIDTTGADFVMTGGDNAQAGMETEYDAFFRAFDGIGAPLRVVRGNHDRGYFGRRMERLLPSPRREPGDRGSEEPAIHVWNGAYWDVHTHNVLNLPRTEEIHYPFWQRTQPPVLQLRDRREYAYSFEEKGWLFIVLDTSPWILSRNQTDWLRGELARAPGTPAIVFLHHSLLPCGIVFDAAPLWNRWEVLDILASSPRVKGIFNAHLHMNRIWTYRGIPVVTTGRAAVRHVSLDGDRIASITPLEEYEGDGSGQEFLNRHFFITARLGRTFLVQDGELWGFRRPGRPAPFCGYAWAETDCPVETGLEWIFPVAEDATGEEHTVRVNAAVEGAWTLRVADAAGATLAERSGSGTGACRVETMAVRPARSGLHTIRFSQPPGQARIAGRAAFHAFATTERALRTDLRMEEPR